jgi:hypothetical protein
MKALEIAQAETMRIALQQEISRSDESRYDHRLHGVLLVCQATVVTRLATGSESTRLPSNGGFTVLKRGVLLVCVKASEQVVRAGWKIKHGSEWRRIYGCTRGTWATARTFGMESC